ncbi:MAG: hypothetical protein JO287_18275 [Pseudonocardiales bacterium]|nr:hypothetical protein [Pseudonocardiales bacterium]
MTTAPPGRIASWYLRTYKDEDTHRAAAVASDGTVQAVCGMTFVPLLHPLDGSPACLTSPPDMLQVCPRCRRADAR